VRPRRPEILYNRDDEHELAETLAASLEKARAVKMARWRSSREWRSATKRILIEISFC
jgi:hypothetical protein